MCSNGLAYMDEDYYDPKRGKYVSKRVHHRDVDFVCSYSNLPSVSSYSDNS